TDDLTITGPGAASLRIEGQGLSRLFVLWEETPLAPSSYTLHGLTLSGGWGVSPYDSGTTIWGANDGGALAIHFAAATLRDLVLETNLAQDAGGAIYYNGVESLTIERCTFRSN